MSEPRSPITARSASADRAAGAPDSATAPIQGKRSLSANDILDQALAILTVYVSPPTARSILNLARQRRVAPESAAELSELLASIEGSLGLFVTDSARVRQCVAALQALADVVPSRGAAVVVPIRAENDIVNARIEGRRVAAAAGFSTIGLTRLMTAISEVARNIVLYAGQGQIEILPVSAPTGIEIVARDQGPGIPNLEQIFAGQYKSRLGMGLGLRGVKKLADQFEIRTGVGAGTVVRFVVRVA